MCPNKIAFMNSVEFPVSQHVILPWNFLFSIKATNTIFAWEPYQKGQICS